jgi:hypothetical protein
MLIKENLEKEDKKICCGFYFFFIVYPQSATPVRMNAKYIEKKINTAGNQV